MSETRAPTTNVSLAPAKPSLFARSVALMKPVTWFAPAWAFLCGAIASGATQWTLPDVGRIAVGTLLCGPIVCGLSQVMNDYCDREVDALNEPQRLIPSGLVSPRHVFTTLGVLAVIATVLALYLGRDVALLTAVGLLLAVVYSAHPLRAKRNGWIGNALVAVAYEALPWVAGHAAFGQITTPSVVVASLYAFGAHGIMTINDFKSMDGDRRLGIKSIPVQYGAWAAAWLAVITMNVSQLFVIVVFAAWSRWWVAAIILALFVAQIPLQRRLIRDPRRNAIMYNASGTTLFVWGMLAAAIGLRG